MSFIGMMREKWSPPQEPTTLFTGQTILITGTTSGLGYEAALKLANLQVSTLIITARTEKRGEVVKQSILSSTTSPKPPNIIPLALDMSSLSDVKGFLPRLQAVTSRLDAAILNCGLMTKTYEISADGFETTFQVNTLSTVYLATLLLPILKQTSETTNSQTHLTLISSRNSTNPQLLNISGHMNAEKPLSYFSGSTHHNGGIVGAQTMYSRSKLLLEYCMRHLVHSPLLTASSHPSVIINSVCPGACRSDLARQFDGMAIFVIVKAIFYTILAKPTDVGARPYVSALYLGEESVGRMWTSGGGSGGLGKFQEDWKEVTSQEAKELGNRTWQEVREVLVKFDDSVRPILG